MKAKKSIKGCFEEYLLNKPLLLFLQPTKPYFLLIKIAHNSLLCIPTCTLEKKFQN